MNDSDDRLYNEAVKAVKEKREFFQHLVVYIAVCTFLSVMFLVFNWRGFFWPIFVICGWGIGVASHGVTTFLGKEWEKRKVQEYIDKHGDNGEEN